MSIPSHYAWGRTSKLSDKTPMNKILPQSRAMGRPRTRSDHERDILFEVVWLLLSLNDS